MLSILLGAVALAGVVVLAAHGARERRALAADVRSLRLEVRRVREALSATRPDAVPRVGGDALPLPTDPGAHDEPDGEARGSRTLH